jgi:hypothetical protein
MAKSYTIEYVSDVTKVLFIKTPSYSEIKFVIDDIADNFPYEKRLWNLINTQFNFSENNLKAIAEYGKTKFTAPNKLAVVAPNDMAYEEMKIFQDYRSEGEHSQARIFRSEPEALDWLKS